MSATIATHDSTHSVPNLLATLFQRFAGHKTKARPITRAEQAEELRQWASSNARHHRGFQDDLYAAADRHERGV
jgi:hypothetical protein